MRRPCLRPETVRLMRARPGPPLRVDSDHYYGLGWQVAPAEERIVWWHDGVLVRSIAQVGGNSHGLARAVLFNARPFSQRTFRGEVGRAFRAAYQSVTTWPAHDLFEAYAGADRSQPRSRRSRVDTTSDAAALHQALVDQLKDDGHIESPRVEGAFRAVPRHHFLPEQPIAEAYRNRAIPTKHLDGEAVSSSSEPAIMAIMLEMLDLQPGQNVLEIGAGTGYNAALMAQIVGETGQVTAIDIDQDIVEAAQAHLAAAGAEAARRARRACACSVATAPSGMPRARRSTGSSSPSPRRT